MANTTPSTNMSMPVPVVGSDPGPTWGSDLNNCLTIIDGHDHSAGFGVQITPAGLNINSTLTFNNNQITNAQFLGMYVQSGDPSTLGCLYYKGVDLYFNDGSSNHIRLTASGSVSGATGTITGLPSGTASASYQSGSGTFVFQSATNTGADIDGRSFILRNSSVSSKGLTLSPPAAMGSDIAMTFPTIPASTLVMTMDSGGGMGTVSNASLGNTLGQAMTSTGANAIANTRTRSVGASVAAGGVGTSVSTGSLTFSGAGNVTNLSVQITTTGRPVFISLFPASSGTIVGRITTEASANYQFRRSGTSSATIANYRQGASSLALPPGGFSQIDDDLGVGLVAGTYTYVFVVQQTSGGSTVFENIVIKVYEL